MTENGLHVYELPNGKRCKWKNQKLKHYVLHFVMLSIQKYIFCTQKLSVLNGCYRYIQESRGQTLLKERNFH